MVKTMKVGKQRSFGRGLLLTIVTFGIYGIYWAYKAHDELFKQYELEREGRDQGVVWLILGLIVPFVSLVYYYKFVDNVNYLRGRIQMSEGISPVAFLLWATLGILIIVGPFIAYYKLQTSINDTWTYYDTRIAQLAAQGQATAAPPPIL